MIEYKIDRACDGQDVFFDGKKDLEALHYLLGVGTRNMVDAQVMHMAFT